MLFTVFVFCVVLFLVFTNIIYTGALYRGIFSLIPIYLDAQTNIPPLCVKRDRLQFQILHKFIDLKVHFVNVIFTVNTCNSFLPVLMHYFDSTFSSVKCIVTLVCTYIVDKERLQKCNHSKNCIKIEWKILYVIQICESSDFCPFSKKKTQFFYGPYQ